ncbi:MAG: FKBP-type peptidyl-prolyl cis-trans isomerase [Candidatus Absconditabacteria bacterium]|nr:FKBP-type peptidyl-prolyl cis-trans isomerase [Candidatus Absconditabacteria bacterium]MDD3868785.1 FKBP-type peptidyl-prolyl cis-trans isomerase [Candidatus Absconditabacteria bacterium]MDD4713884.1 FKBP-type peptidyl-prolyl cis-trans isomerase [Candidatus Absconditabacteria bacterium]
MHKSIQKRMLVLASYLGLLLLVGCGAPRIIDAADEVSLDYTLTFSDGKVYDSGTTTLTVGSEHLYPFFSAILLGKQVDDQLSGSFTPDQTFGDLYDYTLQQKLAEGYLDVLEISPEIGTEVALSTLGTGIIRFIDQEEGVNMYTIDFNPMETYEPLYYTLTITQVVKK